MSPQELILSASSSEATASTAGRSASAPAVYLHDLVSASTVQPFKTSSSSLQCVSHVPTQRHTGGAIFAVQEGKAIVNVWGWQKDQMHMKIHLPEKLSCFKVSPNGCWAAGGSPTGHIYLWEISSGLLHASFTAHYRHVTTLNFSSDSQLLTTSSLDSSVHIYLVANLVDPQGDVPKPYGTLNDHTLGIRDVVLSRHAGVSGGRCWTASDDGTVKMWDLHPPFNLLATFSFPSSVIPSTIAVEAAERFFYVGTTGGDIFHLPLFRRRGEVGEAASEVEAVRGDGQGAAPIKAQGSVLSYRSPITSLALSISASHLLIGTQTADIHVHSLPSHQHLRTIVSHSGPITHLSTLLRPADLVGGVVKSDSWPLMEIKPLERMRIGRTARDAQEVTIALRPHPALPSLDSLRQPRLKSLVVTQVSNNQGEDRMAELIAENKRLRTNLEKAVKINEKMWTGIVDLHLVPAEGKQNGDL